MNPDEKRQYSHESHPKLADVHSGARRQVESYSLQAAADFLFRSTEAMRESRCSRRDIFNSEASALHEWGQANGLILAARELDLLTPVSSGAEHEGFL